jgi:uncharacterized Zn finger protein (UPF0148 family)
MKMHPKKTYCPNCHRLRRVIEQRENGNIKLSCPVCGRPLWKWNGLVWQEIKKAA